MKRWIATILLLIMSAGSLDAAGVTKKVWGRVSFAFCYGDWYTKGDITKNNQPKNVRYLAHYDSNGLLVSYTKVQFKDILSKMEATYNGKQFSRIYFRDADDKLLTTFEFEYNGSVLSKIIVTEHSTSKKEIHYYNESRKQTKVETYERKDLVSIDEYFPSCKVEEQQIKRTETYSNGKKEYVREYDSKGNLILKENYIDGKPIERVAVILSSKGVWEKTENYRWNTNAWKLVETVFPKFDAQGRLISQQSKSPDGKVIGEIRFTYDGNSKDPSKKEYLDASGKVTRTIAGK